MSEIDLTKLDAFKNLNEDERKLAMEILTQVAENGQSDILDALKYNDFDEIPVDIDTFLDDKQYLGNDIWMRDEISGEVKCVLFPYWRDTLHKLFPDNLTTAYNTLVLTGSIGLGKTEVASIAMLYLLYRMLCLKDPYSYYGLMPNDKITFSLLNITLDTAKGVGWQKVQQHIQNSPWFMEHGALNASRTAPTWQPNKNIELVFGSSNNQVVGRALFCLDGDTEILTSTGINKIKDLVDKQIQVVSVDNNGQKVLSNLCTVKPTVKTIEEYQIELADGTIIKCTKNHKLRLIDGSYKEAQFLTEDDELMETQQSYAEFIDSIIEERGQWGLDNNFEGHHIIPKCLGGTGTTKAKHPNIIRLTPQEHFIAHKLLALENPKNRSLVAAWEMMSHPKGKTKRNFSISADDYALLRNMWSTHMTINNPGLYKDGHPWNYNLRKPSKKSFIYVTNGVRNLKINVDAKIPIGYKRGRCAAPKKVLLTPEQKHAIYSKVSSGKNNPMYNKGYKIANGNNGHATIRYYFSNNVFESGKELILYLKKYDDKISNSTLRKLRQQSKRVLKEHPVLKQVSWEEK